MESKIKITILGDICPTDDYKEYFDNENDSFVSDIISLLQKSDFSVCNLECPATKTEIPIKKTGPNLKADPKILGFLARIGINAVSLSNNHILDYGQSGVLETISCAEKAKLKYFGAGRNNEEASRPLIVEIKTKKIGFLSFAEHEFNVATEKTAGSSLFDPYISPYIIAETKKKCDYLIVLYHGGIEHYEYPSPLLQRKCRLIADAGADAVFCQHSHCIGTRENYNGSEILYGQGNTIFGFREANKKWNEGILVQLCIDKGKIDVNYRILKATKTGIQLMEKEAEKNRLDVFCNKSKNITDFNFVSNQWGMFCDNCKSWYLPMMMGWSRVAIKINRLLKNGLVRLLIGKRAYMTAMNLIRCDAHKEVLDKILSQEP